MYREKKENPKKQKLIKEKPQKPKYNMWQNTIYMITLAWKEKEKKVLLLCVLSAAFAVLNNLVTLYVVPMILSVVETQASEKVLLTTILGFVGAMIICTAGSAYVEKNTQFGRITVRRAIISRLNTKAATTSYQNLNDDSFKKLLAKSNGAVCGNDESTEAVWTTLTDLLKNLLGFLIYVLLLSYVNQWLILVILLTAVLGYFATIKANSYRYYQKEQINDVWMKQYYLRRIACDNSGAKDIRIFHLKPWIDEVGKKALAAWKALYKGAQDMDALAKVVDLVLSFLRNAVAYVYLIRMVLADEITASEFLLYFSAVGGFAVWVNGILTQLGTLHRQSLDISVMRECLEYPECFKFEDGEALLPEHIGKFELRLENVSLRYPGAGQDTLSHINLTLHAGEKLAIVGLNGAGKTTLVKLLCGLLDPTEGRVLLDGKDIRDYNRSQYYQLFSAVFQTFSLYAGSIAANVAQSEDDIDMEKVIRCVEKAGLRAKIESLPDGYETLLYRKVYEDAIMLSGGETQRLMLARALYKDAPFIILDEPTAALDPIAEADMYQKYHEMTNAKASVYISHRLASTRFCDRIIFMENNGIAEEGTHEGLMKQGGKYAELFRIQSKYYQEGGSEDEGR